VKAIGENRYEALAKLAAAAVQRKAQHADRRRARRSAAGIRARIQTDPRDGGQRTLELRAIIAPRSAPSGRSKRRNADRPALRREWWVRYRAAESADPLFDTDDSLRRVEQRQDRYAREMLQLLWISKRFAVKRGA
jgi:hypothetical protein